MEYVYGHTSSVQEEPACRIPPHPACAQTRPCALPPPEHTHTHAARLGHAADSLQGRRGHTDLSLESRPPDLQPHSDLALDHAKHSLLQHTKTSPLSYHPHLCLQIKKAMHRVGAMLAVQVPTQQPSHQAWHTYAHPKRYSDTRQEHKQASLSTVQAVPEHIARDHARHLAKYHTAKMGLGHLQRSPCRCMCFYC